MDVEGNNNMNLDKYHHDYWERVGIAINEGHLPEFTAKEMAASQIFNNMKADGMNLLEIREAIKKISADII